MEHIELIVKIEARAKFLNLTPTAAYRKAGVNANSFSRWKLKRNSPNLRTFSIAISKVNAFLEAEELAQLARLHKLHPEIQLGHGEAE